MKHLLLLAAVSLAGGLTAQTSTEKFCQALKSKMVTSDPDIEWTQFGPGMSGNNKMAFWHNSDPNTLFIAPNMGNAYRSTDKGITYSTILNADEASILSGRRGPKGFNDMQFSYQNPNFGFCIDTANRGIFVTTNRGETWQSHDVSTVTFGGKYLSSVAVDPKDDNVWYVGCGKVRNYGRILYSKAKPHNVSPDKNSVGLLWKSTDRGESWTLANTGINPKAEIESLLVDPANSRVVYASTSYGFYKSNDAGATWVAKNSGLDTDVLRSFSYHYDKGSDQLSMYTIANVMWRADGETVTDSVGGIFRSNDRGESWQNISGDIALDMRQFKGNKAVERSYIHPVAFYYGISDKEATQRFPEMPSKITQRFNQITVDPNDPDNLYLVNEYSNASRTNFMPGQIWRSKDGGKHWYITSRNGKNWEENEADIAYWKERGNPVGNNVSFNYLHDWSGRDVYDRKSCNFTRFNCDGTVLHTQLAKISLMSYDKGDTWVDIDDVRLSPNTETYVGAGNSNMPGHGFYQDLRLPNQVFCCAGENSLWVTTEGGESVRPNAQAATNYKFSEAEQSLSCYAIHPHDTNIRYATFFRQEGRGELWRTLDGGATWAKHGTIVPQWEVKAHSGDQPCHQLNLIIDPANPNNMYLCVPKTARSMEYVGHSETGFGVHKSTDGGKTWALCNNNMPNDARNPYDIPAIAFDPKNSNTLYACYQGSNKGLYRSTNRGESWSKVTSLPQETNETGVNDIHFANNGKVYITSGNSGTSINGGGAWVSSDGMQSWKRIFDFPATFRIETAHYNPDIILLSTLSNRNILNINPGTYLSKNGGRSWVKINKGNGQSDRINDIAIDNYTPNKYYLSTYGSGFYVAHEK